MPGIILLESPRMVALTISVEAMPIVGHSAFPAHSLDKIIAMKLPLDHSMPRIAL